MFQPSNLKNVCVEHQKVVCPSDLVDRQQAQDVFILRKGHLIKCVLNYS